MIALSRRLLDTVPSLGSARSTLRRDACILSTPRLRSAVDVNESLRGQCRVESIKPGD